MQRPQESSTPSGRSPRDVAEAGWRWRLAALVSAFLTFEGLSGLWLYLGSFSVFSQLLVVAHTLVGLAMIWLVMRYQLEHLGAWYRQTVTAAMVLGYALLATITLSLVSGLVLAWQAAVGPRLSPLWDLVHLVSGLAALGLVLVHLLLAYLRRRLAARRDLPLRAAMALFARRVSLQLVGVAAALLTIGLVWPTVEHRSDVPADYTLPASAQEFDEYRDNPFAPTFARTDDLRLVSSDLLANSASCGTARCHDQILAEWEPSAHRFSAMNPPFQEVQRRFAAEREPAETRYCAGCHDPISLFAGAKDLHSLSLSAPGMTEGISCVACHTISKVDQRGNADYVLTPPEKYLWEDATGVRKLVSDFLIRAYPLQHLADYDRNILRTPEYCGACHKQFIPEALNRFGNVEGQNQYDEWKNGHWHSDDPETDLSCTDCHMRLVYESDDPAHGESGDVRRSAEDGAHRHHGFIATNNFMPAVLALPHWEHQVELTNAWMRGETVLPEIAHLWPEGPVAGLDLIAPRAASPGSEIDVRIIVTNRKAGHNFITGPLDFVRSWIHLQVLDADGEVLAEWGSIDPESRRILDEPGVEHAIGNSRGEGTFVLEALPIDEEGNELREHELWRKAGGKGKRVIFPNYSDSHAYRIQLPDDLEGEVRLHARLNYRRYRQEFLDLVLPGLEESVGVYQPTVTQSEVMHAVEIDPALAAAGGG